MTVFPLLFCVLCAGMIGFWRTSRVERPRRGSASRGIVHALSVTVAICAALGLAAFILFQVRQAGPRKVVTITMHSRESHPVPDLPPEPPAAPALLPASSVVVQPSSNRGAAEADEDLTNGPHHRQDGNVIWLPLSEEVIAGILSPEGAAAVAELNESLPPELRQAYAMIPLSPTGPPGGSAVLHQAFSSAVVRQAFTPQNLQAAVRGIVRLVSKNDNPKKQPTPEAARAEAPADQDYAAAEWIDHPGIGRVVVKSEFVEAGVSAAEALRPAIVEALRERVTKLTRQEFNSDGQWDKLVDIAVSDEVLSQCIVETDVRTEVISTVDGPKRMQQTRALVDIPEALETQILKDVRSALKQNRAIAVCITVGLMWLAAVLLAVAVRAGQHGSLLRKLATVPVLSLLCLPCLLISLFMAHGMIDGQTFRFEWSGEKMMCSIDKIDR